MEVGTYLLLIKDKLKVNAILLCTYLQCYKSFHQPEEVHF